MTKLSTGLDFLNLLLNGGYDADVVTTIYGPSGSGKTNLCLIAAIETVNSGKKVIFVDTEGGIAVERIKQLHQDYGAVLPNLLFFNPVNFSEQNLFFDKLKDLVTEQIGLIVVDSISMLYRLELGKSEEVYDVNASLGRQLACLVEIARRKNIPVLITNQVYSGFENRDGVKMVGGDLLKYGSKCLIELQKGSNDLQKSNGYRILTLRKHRSLPEGLSCKFKIVEKGVAEVR
jgi:DNA repair protein RadB